MAAGGIATQTALNKGCSIFQALCPLYLASASPRRKEFFQSLGLPAVCLIPPAGAEPLPVAGEPPADFALRAALAKASGALPLLPGSAGGDSSAPLIIAADTVVVLDNAILGKPDDAADAFAMLSRLRGRSHTVITGCALLSPAWALPRTFAVSSRVSMWDCPPALLRAYAGSGEPLDKAGAYAVQGAGAFLVTGIEGSWSNVVGLPLAELVQALLEAGAVRPLP